MSGSKRFRRLAVVPAVGSVVALVIQSLTGSASAKPSPGAAGLTPGNLVYSSSIFQNGPAIVPGVTQLPPGCAPANCVTATADGNYPEVFDNALTDGSFGVTSPVYLNEMTTSGSPLGSFEVPNGGIDQNQGMVTSFSSKSELALNLSTNGQYLTFMGYNAPVDGVDVSNSNTPGVIDPTNPVPSAYYRVVAALGENGGYTFTETNAYSGNNGRAAILNDSNGADNYFAAGNAGNGANPQPLGVIEGAGAQWITPTAVPESAQNPVTPTAVGSFSVTQLGDKADKVGKDDNFRGLAVYNNVVYYTKGSGGNGVDTVYFIDTTGKACPTTGVGVPQPGAAFPTGPLALPSPAVVAKSGLPNNMCILAGFPINLAKTATMFPFGIWFANPSTVYVTDEGSGSLGYSQQGNTYVSATAAVQPDAGLEKWSFNSSSGTWDLDYTLQDGLDLGRPYHVAGYPTSTNPATGLPWSPATDGLRNLTGRVNANGTVTIWAISSTVSGSGDQGADPNKIFTITDSLAATTPPHGEHFSTVVTANNGEVLRGISFTPGS
ncbi:MAG TPA: hypothetical protein VHA57_09485 [Actinomycetota bacterium]|nr:hypothetical protein [Actinomycetota bacterium]